MRKLNLLLTLVALIFATTSLWAVPTGALPGGFTINSNCDMVYFSQGNLQYQASTDTWRFATNQYDYVGDATNGNVYIGETKCNNALVAEDYTGWIDFFGWGTGDEPTKRTTEYSDYLTYTEWGNNAIINGGNEANSGWRTLTQAEWDYVVSIRPGNRYAKATVNGVRGLILLPDNWSTSYYPLSQINTSLLAYDLNIITADNWTNSLQAHGAVFLPLAGYRNGSSIPNSGIYGVYWSSTHRTSDERFANTVDLQDTHGGVRTSNSMYAYLYMANAVRLVQDMPEEEEYALRLKASATSSPTAASNLTYNGSSQYLLVSAAGAATGGTVKYRLGTSGSWQTSYNSSNIRATNAGTYTVQWYVQASGSGCYLDSEIESIEVTIKRRSTSAPNPMPTVTAATSLAYTGSAQDLVTATGSTQSGYTLVYSTDGVNWSTTIPQGTNVGDYTVYYKFYKGDNEEYVPASNTINVTIAKGDLSGVTLPEATSSLPYDGTEKTLLEVDPVAGATIWYKLGDGEWTTTPPTATDANDYSVQYKIVPDDELNYNTIGPNTVTVTILDYPTVYDNADPTAKLTELLNTPSDLKIKRTIYADDEYNTICLPFALDESALAASPLAGFNRLKTFKGAQVTGTAPDLYIDIFVEDATTIEAGIPYLITYPSAHADIVDPVFTGITVTTTEPSAVSVDGITFQGMFAQVHIDPYDAGHTQDYLFVGANSQLYWPLSTQTSSDIKMRGFRAYFIIDRNSISPALAPKGTRARIMNAPKTTTAIDNTSAKFGGSEKIIENGILYIIRNGVKYNAQGQVIK